MNRIRSLKTKPDSLFICAQGPQSGPALRQLRAAGINQPVLGGDSQDGDFWKNGVPNVSNIFFTAMTSTYGDDPNSAVNKLVKDLGPFVTGHGPSGYTIMQLWAKAVAKVKSTDGKKVAAAIEAFKRTPTVVGPITYSRELHIDLYRQLRMEVQGGKTRFVEIATPKPGSVTIPKV